MSFYDGDPNYPFICNIRYGLGQNTPKAELNELVIQLQPGVEMRIDKQKHLVTLTPEDIWAEAGKNCDPTPKNYTIEKLVFLS